MSQEERDRLHWLRLAREKKITQRQAAERMGVSERWVRKLLRKLKRKGDRAVELIRAEYRDFGPKLASGYLVEEHGVLVGKEAVRQRMIEFISARG